MFFLDVNRGLFNGDDPKLAYLTAYNVRNQLNYTTCVTQNDNVAHVYFEEGCYRILSHNLVETPILFVHAFDPECPDSKAKLCSYEDFAKDMLNKTVCIYLVEESSLKQCPSNGLLTAKVFPLFYVNWLVKEDRLKMGGANV